MTMNSEERANTIVEQFGGHRALVMIGGNASFRVDAGLVTVSIRFKAKAKRRINHVEISLNAADLYDVAFWRISMRTGTCKKLESVDGVYASDLRRLFESTTGLATHL